MISAGAQLRLILRPLTIVLAVVFVFASVITGLVNQWWNDENYSHGLIVPLVVAFIVWQEFSELKRLPRRPELSKGLVIVSLGAVMLLVGTLGAELFTQRVSLIVVLIGVVVYFFGRHVLYRLAAPFVMLLLAMPIPQIILNKILFPLQLLATRVANAGLSLFGTISVRKGNVIELTMSNGGRTALEVAEACSGIRSLVTLMTLALVFAYFTRTRRPYSYSSYRDLYHDSNFWRTVILMLSAVPIALVTNASRVFFTGVATYYYGPRIVDSWGHDAFAWISFGIALILLVVVNFALSRNKLLPGQGLEVEDDEGITRPIGNWKPIQDRQVVLLFVTLLCAGLTINWLEHRTPPGIDRRPLSEFPYRISNSMRMGADIRFDAPTERVLGASDYVMRNYIDPPRKFNLYIGYYDSQRTGATYHSPLNCLPGSGWEMNAGKTVNIATATGFSFNANQYVVQRGSDRQMMIYWYEGRGRTNTSEYSDKLFTVFDSIAAGRSDGAMIRVLTPVYDDESDVDAQEAAKKFAAGVFDAIPRFVPN